MHTNKNAQLRYNLINKCLSNFQWRHTYYSIFKEVNQKLLNHAYRGIKNRQLQDDIKFIESLDSFNIKLVDALIKEEKLNEAAVKRYILSSLNREYASENVTELNSP